ncbi:MAG: kinase/pyrophosphorylase [Candidatus Syntrophonatronum acetioxidans]|uniref:Putative pyruvate, phosphate dikinase regulatory protein n=1 Tax=Candidatus Syntrophonatronum acetioxidans TaxID=1795816 RepID=A0A424YDX3_9FIRM|nr:MAG: kinase/pyrophosphorylase [Candidatus Syntrophonatronum acetioxidans]
MDNTDLPVVYVLSDSIGETAEFVVKAAASQFNSGHIEIRRIPFVYEIDTVMEVVEEASEFNSIIAYTLVLTELKEQLEKAAAEKGIPTVDILGPMMGAFTQVMKNGPRMEPGLMRRLDEEYFHRIAAIEFAVKYDDGKDPRGLLRADVVLIGVSRTSKTPLSMYLAHKRIKVANLPLVPEIEPPEELYMVPLNKIVGLTINSQQLYDIRVERLKTLGLTTSANYANMKRILEELEYAENFMKKLGCPIFDVSNKAVEEVANYIFQFIKKGSMTK